MCLQNYKHVLFDDFFESQMNNHFRFVETSHPLEQLKLLCVVTNMTIYKNTICICNMLGFGFFHVLILLMSWKFAVSWILLLNTESSNVPGIIARLCFDSPTGLSNTSGTSSIGEGTQQQ